MIPEEELHKPLQINFAPMVDFLFLIVAVFAIALTMKTSLFDTSIHLVKTRNKSQYSSQDKAIINISIAPHGGYQWITDYQHYPLESPEALTVELQKQKQSGLLPQDNQQIAVLVHIDKNAPWEPIAKLLIEMKHEGYSTHPVYETEPSVN
jgi:biopolymer transport protein ExbD